MHWKRLLERFPSEFDLRQQPSRIPCRRRSPHRVNQSLELGLADDLSEVSCRATRARVYAADLQRVPWQCQDRDINNQVYVDFDGTMMPIDTTDFLFERFALPEWRAVEEQWAAGLIGSRECMARQVDLLRATPEQIAGAVDELEMDPGCGRFLATCEALGFGAIVVWTASTL